MVIKQKYSAVTSVAAYMFLLGSLLLGWVAYQELPVSFHSFKEPSLGSPLIFAQEPAEEPLPVKINKKQLSVLLQAGINDFVAERGPGYSVYVEHPEIGASAEYLADDQQVAGSMYKLFVANETFKMIDEGRLLLDAIIDGQRGWTLSKCLERMITVSDNDCGVVLQRVTGAVNSHLPQLKRQGLDSTDLRGYFPTTTARDIARLYRNLLNQNYLSVDSNQQFLDLLADQQINDRLPQGLPDDVLFMHKTGDLNGFAHDGGIVRDINGDQYIVVLMSGPEVITARLTDRYVQFGELSAGINEIMTSWQQ